MDQTEVQTQEQVTDQTEEKTFTQAELNAIVQRRVAETMAKYENYEELKEKAQKFDTIEEESKSELQKATERADALQKQLDSMKREESLRTIRVKVSEETGVPVSLLAGETEEECQEQAKAILAFAKPGDYPAVKDGGEVVRTGKRTTQQQFVEWANKVL